MEMVVDMNNLILFLSKIAECHGCCYLMTVLFNSFAVYGNVHRVTRLENKTCLFFYPRLLSGQTTSFLCIDKVTKHYMINIYLRKCLEIQA